jgi:hypothetical protein
MEKSVLEKIAIPKVENHYNLTSSSARYPGPQTNGPIPDIRQPLSKAISSKPYKEGPSLFGENNRVELVGRYHSETPLNAVFFSDANVNRIQEGIIEQVSLMSGNRYRIDRQSDDDLKIIMRSYYLMYAKNNPRLIAEELEDLNRRVVGYASAKIYSEVDFHMFYLKDLEQFPDPISNPKNTQVFGTRTGELKSFF